MSTTTFRVFAITLAASMFASDPCRAQESQPAAATMPSDQELRDALALLLKELGESRIDLGLDGLAESKARMHALRRAIGDFTQEVRKRGVDETGMRLLEREVVSLRNDVFPRLGRRVIRVGADMQVKDLAAAQPMLQPGDLVLLGAGTFTMARFRDSAPLQDVAIVGLGATQTLVKVPRGGSIDRAERLLLDGLRIDCREEAVVQTNQPSTVMLRDCELFNYNNGHGGAFGVGLDQGVVWLERCLFEGASGTMQPEHYLGDPMRLSSQVILVARECQFVDNRSIIDDGMPALLDRCLALNALGRSDLLRLSSNSRVWHRESDSLLEASDVGQNETSRLEYVPDDAEFVNYVFDPTKTIDEGSKQLATALALQRRLPYWIGLLHHPDAQIRSLAKTRVEALVDVRITLPNQLPKDGERLSDEGAWLEIEREFGRTIDWFEANRLFLRWNPASLKYEIAEGAAE